MKLLGRKACGSLGVVALAGVSTAFLALPPVRADATPNVRVTVALNPEAIPADGRATASVIVTMTDSQGHPVLDGVSLRTNGDVSFSDVVDCEPSRGVCKGTLIASHTPGPETITATTSSGGSGSVVLTETPFTAYWLAAADGGVFSYGDAPYLGSHGGSPLKSPIVSMVPTATGKGYWLASANGDVFPYGDAYDAYRLFGGPSPTSPIVGMVATRGTRGYWLAGRDGKVFTYGEAPKLGSLSMAPNAPLVGIQATPQNRGYWLAAADGGVFAFGDASFFGSTGNIKLNQPIVGIASTPTGKGYWLVASDGGVFAFGDARFYGSTAETPLRRPIVGIAGSPTGQGYWLVASDGGVFAYGDAIYKGSHGGSHLNSPIVAIATG